MSDTGATANLVRFRWLKPHNRLSVKKRRQKVSTCPRAGRHRFGDARHGDARRAADIPAGIAGNQGKLATFVLDADIPSLLRKGALEALGGQLDSRGIC